MLVTQIAGDEDESSSSLLSMTLHSRSVGRIGRIGSEVKYVRASVVVHSATNAICVFKSARVARIDCSSPDGISYLASAPDEAYLGNNSKTIMLNACTLSSGNAEFSR